MFVDEGQRKDHEKTHRAIKEHACRHCDRKFSRLTNARCHERSCRTGILTFPREQDDDDNEEDANEFEDESSALGGASQVFRLHFAPGIRNLFPRLQVAAMLAADRLEKLQQEGKSLKYFVSLHCKQVFVDEGQRKDHEKTHRAIKEHACRHCNRKFSRLTNARCHQRSCRTGILTFPREQDDDDNEEDANEFEDESSALYGASQVFRLHFAPGIRNLFPRLQVGGGDIVTSPPPSYSIVEPAQCYLPAIYRPSWRLYM